MRPLAFILCLVAGLALAADLSLPPLTGRVVDQANVLLPQTEADLSEQLAAHERTTSQQVVVVTVPSLEGQAIEEYGVALGRAWGIGEKGKNTGAILLIAPNDKQVRIEVGYGLEGQLTDALSRVIIERDILPRFRAGQMEAGIVAGAGAMLAVLRGDEAATAQPAPSLRSQDPGEIPLVVILVFFVVFMILRRVRRRISPWAMLGAPAVWHGGSRKRGRGFGGFGGGGFRGGGGSFGGGGASGRW